MRLYIRHAEKEYNNGHSILLKHDPGLTELGRLQAEETCKLLLKLLGRPHVIVCSPYKRARETAIIMAAIIGNDIEIKCDIRLAEYVGNHKDRGLDVDDDTRSYNPPYPESFYQMDDRVRRHNDDMAELDESNRIVWFITHGIIVNRLANCLGYTIHKYPAYLFTMVIEKQETLKCSIIQNSVLRPIEKQNNCSRYHRKYDRIDEAKIPTLKYNKMLYV